MNLSNRRFSWLRQVERAIKSLVDSFPGRCGRWLRRTGLFQSSIAFDITEAQAEVIEAPQHPTLSDQQRHDLAMEILACKLDRLRIEKLSELTSTAHCGVTICALLKEQGPLGHGAALLMMPTNQEAWLS